MKETEDDGNEIIESKTSSKHRSCNFTLERSSEPAFSISLALKFYPKEDPADDGSSRFKSPINVIRRKLRTLPPFPLPLAIWLGAWVCGQFDLVSGLQATQPNTGRRVAARQPAVTDLILGFTYTTSLSVNV